MAVEPGDTTEGGDTLLRLCCLAVDGAGVVGATRIFGPEDPVDPVLVSKVALAPAPAFRKPLGVENEGGEGV